MLSNVKQKELIELYKAGNKLTEISAKLNTSYATVKRYVAKIKTNTLVPANIFPETIEQKKAYAYILGQYLGDGCISKRKRTFALNIYSFQGHKNLIKEIAEKLKTILPNNKLYEITKYYKGNPSCTISTISNNNMTMLFPQHGRGTKHTRSIILEQWQKDIVNEFPKECLRGLYHSDGSRYVRGTYKDKKYISYNFVNLSKDIIKLYCDIMDQLQIGYKISSRSEDYLTGIKNTVFTHKKKDVDYMDSFLGPKT